MSAQLHSSSGETASSVIRAKLPRFMEDLSRHGIASVTSLGRYDYRSATAGLAVHLHERTIEICFLIRGRQAYFVGNKMYYMRGGDVFMTQPDERHSTGDTPQEKGLLYWINLLDPAATRGRFLDLPKTQSRQLWRELCRENPRHFRSTPAMKLHLDAIAAELHAPKSSLWQIKVTSHFVALLLEVVSARTHQQHHESPDNWLTPVMRHIDKHLANPEVLVLPHLAEIARLSESRFKAKFKADTGIPPAEFIVRERIERAAAMMLKNKSAAAAASPELSVTITDVAFSLGFSSSQYFASVFRRIRGKTPSEFLRDGR
ncbi:MAG: AraC family transcriptional regulator [Candidatus Methylacidiphilales bacterium]|nr:AraC family transcriptional regulator [Candidatus Methylacidiphilales bacterium]